MSNTIVEQLKKHIADFEKSFPKAKHFQVASNHPEHLDRYLDEARYRDDTFNHILGLELSLAKAKGHNVYKYSMEMFAGNIKTTFLTRKDTINICGFEMNNHGDAGSNGSRGNSKTIGETYSGKVITGHTHSPEIGVYNNPVVGTLTDLVLPYTSEAGGSSWGNSNIVLYENGTFTHIHILPDSTNTL